MRRANNLAVMLRTLALDEGNGEWSYSFPDTNLSELVAYWWDGYDWRRAEAAINAYEHCQVSVVGVPVHLMRKPGLGPYPSWVTTRWSDPTPFLHWSNQCCEIGHKSSHPYFYPSQVRTPYAYSEPFHVPSPR